MAPGAAVDEPGAELHLRADVARPARIHPRSEALLFRELALEELPTASNGARRIAFD
jgi:hypothetical protein